MAQLVSGLDAVYRRAHTSWQDTSAPPNVILNALGPGLISPALQQYQDAGNQIYHRESMKGQTADIPNTRPLLILPNTFLLKPPAFFETGQVAHRRESMKGQVADPQNFALASQDITQGGPLARAVVYNPVYKRSQQIQDTTIQRNPVLDLVGVLPILLLKANIFEAEETYHRDSLSGQYMRTGVLIPIGVPPAFNEIYTYVPRLKTAQEPFLFPNVVILGIPLGPPPFVQRQSEDHQYKAKAAQEPFVLPNDLLLLRPATPYPFVQAQREDHQYKIKAAQEPFVLPNNLIKQIPPIIIQPFVDMQYEHQNWRGHPTQEHFDFPNLLILHIAGARYTPLGLAMQILASAGFTVNPVVLWQYSTVVPYYMVISQLPIGGSVIEYQAVPIQLTASAGPPPPSAAQVTVPNVVGMTSLQAMQYIDATPLNVGVVNFIQMSGGNIVTAQSPAPGTTVQSYSSINLTVDSGAPQDMLFQDLYTIPIVSPQ